MKKKKEEKEKQSTKRLPKNYDNFRVLTVQKFLLLPALQTLRRHIEE
jgi:hypothetical protein